MGDQHEEIQWLSLSVCASRPKTQTSYLLFGFHKQRPWPGHRHQFFPWRWQQLDALRYLVFPSPVSHSHLEELPSFRTLSRTAAYSRSHPAETRRESVSRTEQLFRPTQTHAHPRTPNSRAHSALTPITPINAVTASSH